MFKKILLLNTMLSSFVLAQENYQQLVPYSSLSSRTQELTELVRVAINVGDLGELQNFFCDAKVNVGQDELTRAALVALYESAKRGQLDILEWLLEKNDGDLLPVPSQEEINWAFWNAAANGHVCVMMRLMEKRSNYLLPTPDIYAFKAALNIAAKLQRINVLTFLSTIPHPVWPTQAELQTIFSEAEYIRPEITEWFLNQTEGRWAIFAD